MALVQRYLFLASFLVFSALWAVYIRLRIALDASPSWVLLRLRDWASVMVWLLEHVASIKVVIEGQDNVPAGACVFVSRHESFFDTVIFFLISLKTCYIMKIELRKVPLYGYISEFVGLIFTDRKGGPKSLAKMIKDGDSMLKEGRHVVIFPQGTRMSPNETGDYNSSVSGLYKRYGVPFVPVAMSSAAWPKDWKVVVGSTIHVKILPPKDPGLAPKVFMEWMIKTIETESAKLREFR